MALSFVQKRFMSSSLQRLVHKLSGFNQLGLMRDDMLWENEEVAEALRRLPQKLRDERNYRIIRALQLTINQEVLPKDQWVKLEEDVTYLQPYLKQVQAEKIEEQEWNKTH